MKQKDMDLIFKLCKRLAENMKSFSLSLINDSNNRRNSPEMCASIVLNKFSEYHSSYKRDKACQLNQNYVNPEEKGVGIRWEMRNHKSLNGISKIPRMQQSSLQYVSITKTLGSLFNSEEFRTMYFNHNNNRNHICSDGHYKNFCCSSSYKGNKLFRDFPNSLQIQIASDDVEICSPLGSKSNRHKICMVYFLIRNIPAEYSSKLNNIYLVCVCNADDLKTKYTDFNNIWRLIVSDIRLLETNGINIDENTNIKGTITHLAFDNLGANTALGFSGGSNSSYYCQICECHRDLCQQLTKDCTDKYRTRDSYTKQIEIIAQSEKVDYNITKGIKYFCELSNLKYFHPIQTPTVDIMHDLNEGAIPFALKQFFQYAISNKVFSLEELNEKIQFYYYGPLSESNKPSQIQLDKRSLGQNATQSLCLMQNIPYILFKYKENPALKDLWECITSLLRIIEVVYSYEVSEMDLKQLEIDTTLHLESIKCKFLSTLKPKHHFILHYSNIIRLLGPLVYFNMFRFESKHKFFKTTAQSTNNYKNINKTLAIKHQQLLCQSDFTYKNNIDCGVKKQIKRGSQNEILFQNYVQNQLVEVHTVEWLKFNNYEYRKGLLLVFDSHFNEILDILSVDGSYYFIAHKLLCLELNEFLNSFKISKVSGVETIIIGLETLLNKKSYEIKYLDKEPYVIIDTRDLRHIIVEDQI